MSPRTWPWWYVLMWLVVVFLSGMGLGTKTTRERLRPSLERISQEQIWQTGHDGRGCILWRVTDRFGSHYVTVGNCKIAERRVDQ